jgi:hypothetical protein
LENSAIASERAVPQPDYLCFDYTAIRTSAQNRMIDRQRECSFKMQHLRHLNAAKYETHHEIINNGH